MVASRLTVSVAMTAVAMCVAVLPVATRAVIGVGVA